MSSVNISRAVDNIRANTTVYTPVVEMIVNGIQAIDELERSDGKVWVRAVRHAQARLDGHPADVIGFEIEDNGVGFTDEHRASFDTLYTDRRLAEGGKGFGRFTCLKYFEDLQVESVYGADASFMSRRFRMGKGQDIIVDERTARSDKSESGALIRLSSLKKTPSFETKLSTIAKNLVERLLPYFITKNYTCPRIVLSETDGSGDICLNDFVNNEVAPFIEEITVEQNQFSLAGLDDEEEFVARVFKLYSPGNRKSRISLVAHRREVAGSMLHKYIPEFEEEFYEKQNDENPRNYIVKVYVFGSYLDRRVSLERGGFEFAMENDLIYGISQSDVEKKAAEIAWDAMDSEMRHRQEKKKERVQAYVDEEAPWHKDILETVNLSEMAYNATGDEIEQHLQREKMSRERAIKRDVDELLTEMDLQSMGDSVVEIVKRISGASRNDLVHYIAQRRAILDLLGKSLEVDGTGNYAREGVVHDIIFPRGGDTDKTAFDAHNLWIVDERLNFTRYVSSDVALGGGNAKRPDLLVYNRRVLFRGDNEESNPIAIFEFKRPQRDDFANPSTSEDPVQQIVRYVNDIRDDKYKTPEGRRIKVAANTPFYGFVVCDLTQKAETWLEREKNFWPMPDKRGWFQWMGNINLYVEVIGWDKILGDARMRNRIFFRKLGIED